jgi:hypothetical protein
MNGLIYTNSINITKDKLFKDLIFEEFIIKQPNLEINSLQWSEYEKKGIRLIEILGSYNDPRNISCFVNKSWKVNKQLYDGMYSPNEVNGKWDLTEDCEFLCFRWHLNRYFIYKIEKLHNIEIEWINNNKVDFKMETEVEKQKKELLKPILTEMLIQKMFHIDKIFSGEFEINYGIHFKLILRGEFARMRYKPSNNNVDWIENRVLGWSDTSHGWAITTDLSIACCRVKYDEYYNFQIEFLSQEQIEFYRELVPIKTK